MGFPHQTVARLHCVPQDRAVIDTPQQGRHTRPQHLDQSTWFWSLRASISREALVPWQIGRKNDLQAKVQDGLTATASVGRAIRVALATTTRTSHTRLTQ